MMKFRPEADIFPLMGESELRALAEDIDRQGQLEPILLLGGDILDGRNRYLAITRYCISRRAEFKEVSPDDPVAFVVGLNLKRRHLNESQRAMVAARIATMRQGARTDIRPIGLMSQPQAADLLNVGPTSVKRAKAVQSKGSAKLNDAVDKGQLSLGKAEQITKLYPDKKTQDQQVEAVAKSKMVTRVKGLTGEVEWYTPRPYLDAAVEVMGGIDLDPASSQPAQDHVGAGQFYTIEDDGLAQPWSGRVFLNPPYAMPFIKQFVSKMTTAFIDGEFFEGILLTNNATDTEWFHSALKTCAAVCFTRGRISFLQARDGELLQKVSPTHGQAFFYFGSNLPLFNKVFSQFGAVLISYQGDGTT